MNILIVGLGSIAKKHIDIINSFNYQTTIYAYRSKNESGKYHNVINIYSWEKVSKINFSFALITSPSSFHYRHLKKILEFKIPVIVEKPICISRNQYNKLKILKNQPIIYVGYNMRFHPLISFTKKLLKANNQKILEVNCYCGSYLPNWRKKNHKKTYSVSKKLGGGVLFDLSHEIDYLIYLFGYPKKKTINKKKISNITNDSNDYANILMEYDNFYCNLTLNYFRRDSRRNLEIVMEETTIHVDFVKNQIIDLKNDKILYNEKENLMQKSYLLQLEYWFDCLEQNKVPINNLDESLEIIDLIL